MILTDLMYSDPCSVMDVSFDYNANEPGSRRTSRGYFFHHRFLVILVRIGVKDYFSKTFNPCISSKKYNIFIQSCNIKIKHCLLR
jgi:hypothetical protein